MGIEAHHVILTLKVEQHQDDPARYATSDSSTGNAAAIRFPEVPEDL